MSLVDVSQAINLKEEQTRILREKALAVLSSTDWIVVRAVETGLPIPTDMIALRAEARRQL